MKENCLERMERIDSKRKIADFMIKEKQDYEFKKKYARIRAIEFANECDARGLNYHVSVGGLDSITLFLFLKSIGIDAPGITVSSLEDMSIQKVHRALGLRRLKSAVEDVEAAAAAARSEEEVHGTIRRVFDGRLRLRRRPSLEDDAICGVTMFDEKNVEKKAKIGDRVLYKTTDGYWISGDPEHTEFIPEE